MTAPSTNAVNAPNAVPNSVALASRPKVSVCLPVYQGQAYVADAIRSALSQSFADLELVISDNASTDRTGEICRAAAENDPRVRYSRSDVNRGLAWNHNRAFELARGEFAMWMGHDDMLTPTYVARCLEALEQNPDAVVCSTWSNDIDEKGEVVRQVVLPAVAESPRVSERYRDTVQYEQRCDVVFGLMRSDVLRQTQLHGGIHGSDWVLMAEMALRGRFVQIPDYLFSRRKHASQASRKNDRWQNTVVFDPMKAGKNTYPFISLARAFRAAIGRAGLPFGERRKCHAHFRKWLWSQFHFVRDDLKVGLANSIKKRLSDGQVARVKRAKQLIFRT